MDENILDVIRVLENLGFIVDEIDKNEWTASKGNCNIIIKLLEDNDK